LGRGLASDLNTLTPLEFLDASPLAPAHERLRFTKGSPHFQDPRISVIGTESPLGKGSRDFRRKTRHWRDRTLQDGQQPNLGPQVFWIGGDLLQGGGGAEQKSIDLPRVLEDDRADCRRERKYNMKVFAMCCST
jgi:hypothetical protein